METMKRGKETENDESDIKQMGKEERVSGESKRTES